MIAEVVPVVSQESILLWDILYCLKGIDGSYIVSEPLTTPYGVKTFAISSDISKKYIKMFNLILSHKKLNLKFSKYINSVSK